MDIKVFIVNLFLPHHVFENFHNKMLEKKIPMGFLVELHKLILNLGKTKRARLAKTIVKKEKVRRDLS